MEGEAPATAPSVARALVPLAHVADVELSVAFYHLLGFDVANDFTPEGEDRPVWAWLESGAAHLMVARAEEPVAAGSQGVLFYLYFDDVGAIRSYLAEAGIEVGPVTYPFYAPRGEFRVADPDGYVLMITHS